MSQSAGSPPPDEPIIGWPPPGAPSPLPPSQPPEYGQGTQYAAPIAYADDDYDDDWADEDDAYPEDEYGYEYGYDEYGPGPGRPPIFYVFVGLAAVVVGVIAFFLFLLLHNGGGNSTPTPAAQFSILIDSPANNTRVDVGAQQTFAVRAKSTQALQSIALLVNGKSVDSFDTSKEPLPADQIYHATLKTTFDQKASFQVAVRVTTIKGSTQDSSPITIIAVQPLNGTATATQNLTGTVVATVSARTGPGDAFDVVSTFQAGDQVTIVGKSQDGSWLVVKGDGQGGSGNTWVRAAAIQASGPLNSLPVIQSPAAPSPTATNTPPPPTNTPTQTPSLPDFVPGSATVGAGGSTLDVTIANIGMAPYSGPLTIALSGLTGAQNEVFNVNIPANGGTVVKFPLGAPIQSGGSITVTVNPDGAVAEMKADNNSTTFTVQAPPSQPTPTPTKPAESATPGNHGTPASTAAH